MPKLLPLNSTPEPEVTIDTLFGGDLPVPQDAAVTLPVPGEGLQERFVVPPFSVLDARQGYWQERKRQWLSLGIKSELGRGDTPSTSARVGPDEPATYRPIGGRKEPNNGLLGFSEQARSHYRTNAAPGGSPRDAATLGKDGRTVRGDGTGKPLAAAFGSGGPGDLAAGFKQRTLGAIAPNEGGPNGILSSPGKYADPRAIKDHAWLRTHGLGIPQMGLTETGAENLYGAYGRDDDVSRRIAAAQPQSGTSIFDPVICELVYRWFSAKDAIVLDPFAGGSVRGIVASKIDRRYVGVDLRPEQAAANEVQAEAITPTNKPRWVVGDAINIETLCPGEYDLVFSCPPYADLERYSDDPRDLSTMPYAQFLAIYRLIIERSCRMLRNNRFACFVVGDVRDTKTGFYRGFVQDTIAAFAMAGLALYNDAVLVTAVGSLPIRVGKQFDSSRKLGKTHQNILVFVKGDPDRATARCGPVEVSGLEKFFDSEAGVDVADEPEAVDPFGG